MTDDVESRGGAEPRPPQGGSDGAAEPAAQVREEARLLAATLADVLRRVEPDRTAPAGDGTPGDAAPSGASSPEPSGAANPGSDQSRTDSAALSEIVAGAGLVARGGMDLMGGLVSRLLAAGGSPPDVTPTESPGATPEGDRAAVGPVRVVSYRRSPSRRIPVHDASETTELS